jgi:hypothetical protein
MLGGLDGTQDIDTGSIAAATTLTAPRRHVFNVQLDGSLHV